MSSASTRPRPARRIMALAGACAVAALALAGCLDVNADVTINSDAQGSGSFAISLEKQAAGLMQISSLDDFASSVKQQDSGADADALLNSPDCTASETSDSYVYTCPFTNRAFTNPKDPWTIAKDGNEIIFTMTGSAAAGADTGQASSDVLGNGSLGNLVVTVTFPGKITGVKGVAAKQTSDTEATITGSVTDQLDVIITSDASSSPPIGLIVAAIAAILVAIAVVVGLVLLVLRGRNKPAEQAALPSADTDAVVADVVEAEAVVPEAVVPEAVVTDAVIIEDAGILETAEIQTTDIQTTDVQTAEIDTAPVETADIETAVIDAVPDEPAAPDDHA